MNGRLYQRRQTEAGRNSQQLAMNARVDPEQKYLEIAPAEKREEQCGVRKVCSSFDVRLSLGFRHVQLVQKRLFSLLLP